LPVSGAEEIEGLGDGPGHDPAVRAERHGVHVVKQSEHQHNANGSRSDLVLRRGGAVVREDADVVLAAGQVPVAGDAHVEEKSVEVASAGDVMSLDPLPATAHATSMRRGVHDATW
jgi:hypothetical protein